MNFQVDRFEANDLFHIALKDNTSQTSVYIIPDYGALLHSFNIVINETVFNCVDNYSNKQSLESELALSYKGVKLSPFACRIPEGKYVSDGRTYQLSHRFFDGSAIHGLLFNKPFEIVDIVEDDASAAVTLKCHYQKDDPGYPFEYTCQIRYILHEQNVLQVETTVLNLDNQTIPVADGWHPYFKLGNTINDYVLQFKADTMLEFNNNFVPTGKLIYDPSFIHANVIGERQLDNCFVLQEQENSACCVLHNPNNHFTLSFYASSNYPYLQIYTPPHRTSIAIENLSGAPDCFNNGMGLKHLAPGDSEIFNVWYKLNIESPHHAETAT